MLDPDAMSDPDANRYGSNHQYRIGTNEPINADRFAYNPFKILSNLYLTGDTN